MMEICSSALPELTKSKGKGNILKDSRDETGYTNYAQFPPIQSKTKHFLSGNISARRDDRMNLSPREEFDRRNGPTGYINISRNRDAKPLVRRCSEGVKRQWKGNDAALRLDATTDYDHNVLNRRKSAASISSSSSNNTSNRSNIIGVSEAGRRMSLTSRNSTPCISLTRRYSKTEKDILMEGSNRPRSRSTNVPPLLKPSAFLRYPMAARYLRRWYSKIDSSGKDNVSELENLKEYSEDDSSRTSTFELLAKFPSSPEFAQVLHDIIQDVDSSDES